MPNGHDILHIIKSIYTRREAQKWEKEEISTTKYLIHAQINANGIVEKPDVVGAIFATDRGSFK